MRCEGNVTSCCPNNAEQFDKMQRIYIYIDIYMNFLELELLCIVLTATFLPNTDLRILRPPLHPKWWIWMLRTQMSTIISSPLGLKYASIDRIYRKSPEGTPIRSRCDHKGANLQVNFTRTNDSFTVTEGHKLNMISTNGWRQVYFLRDSEPNKVRSTLNKSTCWKNLGSQLWYHSFLYHLSLRLSSINSHRYSV